MTEAELEGAVRNLLTTFGLYGYHTYDSRRSQAGFPDWVIVGQAVLFRELKTDSGQLSSEQTRVKYALQAAGADWDVWRPRDLIAGRIQDQLFAISRRPSTAHTPRGSRPRA